MKQDVSVLSFIVTRDVSKSTETVNCIKKKMSCLLIYPPTGSMVILAMVVAATTTTHCICNQHLE